MLTVTRERRKLSQTDLAKATGVRQSMISQVENGKTRPSAALADRLAEALRCPSSLLYVPLRFQQLPLTFFRKKSRMSMRDVKFIRAYVNLYRLRVEILLRSYEMCDARIVLANRNRNRNAAVRAARELRVYWNVPPGPIQDLTKLVESHGILVIPIDLDNDDFDGLSIYEPNDVLPPMIFLNRQVPGDRWRLTLAHELGHIVLHHHQSMLPDNPELEREAYSFAIEFLAPRQELASHMRLLNMQRLASLKMHWRISMAALLKGAEDRGYVSRWQARQFWARLRSYGRTEPVGGIPQESPKLLETIISHHHHQLGHSLAELSAALHQWPDEFRADFGRRSAGLRVVV